MKITEESSKDSVMILHIICLVFSITHACVCSPILGQSLRIVSNVSVPCAQLEVDPNGYPVTHVELNDDDKVKILQQQGGAYANSFLAKTKAEADQNLPSLVALDSDTKTTILSNVQQNQGLFFSYDNWISRGLIREYLIKTHSPKTRRSRRTLDPIDTDGDTLVLPAEAGLADTYVAPFGVDNLDYCLTRGGPFVDPLHLRMCTVCNSLREMEESIWPRYINEAVCSPHDSSCLLVQGIPHGSCRENVMPIHVLKKQPGSCVLHTKNGVSIVTDHWLKETISIRVG
ncbi:hypothetical protein CAPTEDRAFT_213718, partial [Capitella teleta]